ncbi:MAG: formylglycine-generating enzyme family protein [Gammaproteobacteria bacterium]|nr:formylglycine-generating enzyme family protein [Gammaproteobacteria bacterium]
MNLRFLHHWCPQQLLNGLDRLPLPEVVVTGIVLGCGLGGAGFYYLEAPGWAVAWLALFAVLGWLGYTATPIFDEPNPTRPRPVRDGSLLMVDLPGGRFLMGSPDSDNMAHDNEKPQHEVAVSSFRIAITPVTVGLYRAIIPEFSAVKSETEARLPVTGVAWFDAVEFCNRLSKQAGYRPCYSRRFGRWYCDWRADGYRLPTEAEWEYACRAGTTTRYSFGDDPAGLDAYGWYDGNSNTVQPVATKRANPWGLYDMHGNVWEWCWDKYEAYSPSARSSQQSTSGWRVVRGGSFFNPPEFLRSASRVDFDPELWFWNVGFRCVRVPPQQVVRLSD